MDTPKSKTMKPASRAWALGGLLTLAVALAALVHASTRALTEAEATEAAPASVARFRLEQRLGRFYRPGEATPFTGWVTDHHKGGAVSMRSAVVYGQLHGWSEGRFTNGVVELSEQFVRGRPEGTRTIWHPNGKKRSEGRLVAGQQQGTYRQWTEQGTLAAEAEFKDSKPHGISRAWHPSGCLKAEALMKHGEVVTRHFYPDGVQREPTLLAGTPTP